MEDSTQAQPIILNKKYKVMEKLGSGSFGSIYRCVDITSKKKQKQSYAVKMPQQKKGRGNGQLQYQIKLYQIFSGINGVPKMQDYGMQEQRLYLVIQLLKFSLEDLLQMCSKRFSITTVLNIGIQIITRLESIHRKGFVHRDIKANNFMIGKGQKMKTVYIIDFGLAKQYKDSSTGKHIHPKGGKSLVGTARYASIASHQGFQQCRRDDLQSLGYLLLYFLRGKLPWQGVQISNKSDKYKQIGRMKKQSSIEKLCEQIDKSACAIAKYMQVVKKTQFEQQPNYDYLRKIFKEQLIKRQEENKPLDWQQMLKKREESQNQKIVQKQKSKQPRGKQQIKFLVD